MQQQFQLYTNKYKLNLNQYRFQIVHLKQQLNDTLNQYNNQKHKFNKMQNDLQNQIQQAQQSCTLQDIQIALQSTQPWPQNIGYFLNPIASLPNQNHLTQLDKQTILKYSQQKLITLQHLITVINTKKTLYENISMLKQDIYSQQDSIALNVQEYDELELILQSAPQIFLYYRQYQLNYNSIANTTNQLQILTNQLNQLKNQLDSLRKLNINCYSNNPILSLFDQVADIPYINTLKTLLLAVKQNPSTFDQLVDHLDKARFLIPNNSKLNETLKTLYDKDYLLDKLSDSILQEKFTMRMELHTKTNHYMEINSKIVLLEKQLAELQYQQGQLQIQIGRNKTTSDTSQWQKIVDRMDYIEQYKQKVTQHINQKLIPILQDLESQKDNNEKENMNLEKDIQYWIELESTYFQECGYTLPIQLKNQTIDWHALQRELEMNEKEWEHYSKKYELQIDEYQKEILCLEQEQDRIQNQIDKTRLVMDKENLSINLNANVSYIDLVKQKRSMSSEIITPKGIKKTSLQLSTNTTNRNQSTQESTIKKNQKGMKVYRRMGNSRFQRRYSVSGPPESQGYIRRTLRVNNSNNMLEFSNGKQCDLTVEQKELKQMIWKGIKLKQY